MAADGANQGRAKARVQLMRFGSQTTLRDRVVVQGVSDDDAGRLRELERRGLLPGTRIEVVASSEFEGPIEVRIKGKRVHIPLGLARGMFVV